MKICIDAGHGHNTAGKRCLNGTREWDLNSRIAMMLASLLRDAGHEVVRSDDTTGITDIPLATRCTISNIYNVDLFISIHHNAGLNGRKGGGTQVYWYSSNKNRPKQAKALYDAVVKETKLVGNRAEKVIKKDFYVLKHTKAPAFLLENGFMDGPDDMSIICSEKHAEKTAMGIYNFISNFK